MNRRSFLTASIAAPAAVTTGGGTDIAVIGAGAFGGWTAFYLRQMGASVTLLDAYGPGNSRSSSGGETRLLRADYGEKIVYTKLALHAFKLWKYWQAQWGTRLLVPTGRLLLGKESVLRELEIRQKRLIVQGVPTELLGADELKRRWPQIHTDDVPLGIYNPPEPSGSLLMAREGCRAVASAFERTGGKVRAGRAVPGQSAGGVLQSVHVEGSSELRAEAYVFACGPWLPKIFPVLFENKLRVIRRDVFFVGPPAGDDRFSYPNLPTWGTLHEPWYGFPSVDGRGLKVCPSEEGNRFDPDTDERLVNPYQTKRAHDYVGWRFPSLKAQPIIESRVCQVTNSVGGDFLIDRHPEFSNVWLAGAGSGHGFKHGPALGEYLASRILRKTLNPELDSSFRFKADTF